MFLNYVSVFRYSLLWKVFCDLTLLENEEDLNRDVPELNMLYICRTIRFVSDYFDSNIW